MTIPHDDSGEEPATADAIPEPKVVPAGYRQGIITAITVLLGFSLAFWRFWGFESPGSWTLRSFAPAITLLVAVSLQVVALFRSLRVEDDEVPEYRKTVRWFLASAVVLLIGVLLSMFEAAGN